MNSIENINLNEIKNDEELKIIQKELKKRIAHSDYNWHNKKQSDTNDKLTNFIYKIKSFDELLKKIESENLSEELKDYALNRWYNFLSSKAVEYIIASSTDFISQNKNYYSKTIDFTMNIDDKKYNFDHKNSNFPKSLDFNTITKEQLINYLYDNQSQRCSTHFKSKFFLIFKDSDENQNWKLKSNLVQIKKVIKNYFKNFDFNNLMKFTNEVFAEAIIITSYSNHKLLKQVVLN